MRTIIHSPVFHAFFLLCSLLLLQQQADAHGIRVFAYTSGPDIVVEGRFSSGRAPVNSKVRVFSTKSGKLLLEGKTGKDGVFTFSRPATNPDEGLKIVLVAGEGHQAEWTMTPEDLNEEPMPAAPAAATTPDRATAPDTATTAAAPAAATAQAPATAATPPGQVLDSRALADLVTRSVAREIAPLKKMMMEQMNRGPSMTEILGGIGWLVGIAGLLAALKKK
ncbi:MAG TPA: hypothetical protein ENI89_00475 [Desulfobulbus sp.]|nr:hypothetical protein [Desulfobulbus sp.]